MNQLITKKFKHLLWKDDVGDPFLLTKYCEIFRRSKDLLGCYCWSRSAFLKLQKMGIISNDYKTDDNLYCFDIKVDNLARIIELGAQKRRVSRHGRWLQDKEKRLGHKILPFNPKLKENNEQ